MSRWDARRLLQIGASQLLVAMIALGTIRIYSELLNKEQLGEAMLCLGGVALLDAMFMAAVNQTVFFFCNQEHGEACVRYYLVRFGWRVLILATVLLLPVAWVEWRLAYCLQALALWTERWGGVFAWHAPFGFDVYAGKAFGAGSAWAFRPGEMALFLIGALKLPLLIAAYLSVETSRTALMAVLNAKDLRAAHSRQIVADALLTLGWTVLLLSWRPDWAGLLLGVVAARMCSWLLAWPQYIKACAGSGPPALEPARRNEFPALFGRHLQPFIGLGVVGWCAAFFDRYVVAWFAGVGNAGIYTLAYGLAGRPYNVVDMALTTHFRPQLFQCAAQAETRRVRGLSRQWLLAALAVGAGGWAAMIPLAPVLAQALLAADYRDSVAPLLPLFCALSTLILLTHAFDNAVLAFGGARRLLLIQIAVLPLILLCLGLAASRLGLSGAAYGRLAAECLRLVLAAGLMRLTLAKAGRA